MKMLGIAGYGVRDLMRSRWLATYGGFCFVATAGMLRFSDTEQQALIAVVNIALFVVPLANILFGTMYLYAGREFVELLLSQPIRRSELFGGMYLGLALPVATASFAGILLPLVLLGASTEALKLGLVVAGVSAVLSVVFSAVATVLAYAIDDRVRGLAAAIGVWLLLALVYDGAVLIAAVQLSHLSLERPLVAAMAANPIDLSRLLLLAQFDSAALLGYTGAVFRRLFTGTPGLLIAAGALALWVVAPLAAGARLFHRKDF